VALGLMASVGFKANVDQTRDTLHGLRMLMSLIPAAVGLVAILIVAFYPLNEARMSKIETELKTRRASETPTPSAA
jgi:GPH family glycoside/pentoside/hexuronide:cation symporter